MRQLATVLLLSSLSLSAYASPDQYPEDRVYGVSEGGYTQYGAPSLHKTGKYSLTFDDGPHPTYTAKVLDTLKAANVKATFFIITTNVNEKTFPLVKRMLDEGHLVANHGLTHDNSNTLSRDVYKARIKKSFLDLASFYKRAGHHFDKFFYRFPYAAYGEAKNYNHMNVIKEVSQELMGDNCIQFAFWDIDSGDWIPKMTGAEILANITASNEGGTFITYKTVRLASGSKTQIKVKKTLNNPTSGGVVLQHDVQNSSVVGTPKILEYFKNNNLDVVRLDEVEEFKVTKKCSIK